jgi:hypothetical protein
MPRALPRTASSSLNPLRNRLYRRHILHIIRNRASQLNNITRLFAHLTRSINHITSCLNRAVPCLAILPSDYTLTALNSRIDRLFRRINLGTRRLRRLVRLQERIFLLQYPELRRFNYPS